MPRFEVISQISAPAIRCFDAARDIDLHESSLKHTGERAVGGKTSGLIGLGETVTWRARHLGVVQNLTSRITAFDPPRYFQDRMIQGVFASFVHDHYFEEMDGRTKMRDVIEFRSPLGPLGWLADTLFLRRYLERLITRRAYALRQAIERSHPAAVGDGFGLPVGRGEP
ncbi:MAG: SRPBCC family protein [Acidobacteriota bacterium]